MKRRWLHTRSGGTWGWAGSGKWCRAQQNGQHILDWIVGLSWKIFKRVGRVLGISFHRARATSRFSFLICSSTLLWAFLRLRRQASCPKWLKRCWWMTFNISRRHSGCCKKFRGTGGVLDVKTCWWRIALVRRGWELSLLVMSSDSSRLRFRLGIGTAAPMGARLGKEVDGLAIGGAKTKF